MRATIAAEAACAVYYAISGSPEATELVIGIGIALPLLVLWIAGRCAVKGDRTARFVLAGWLVYLAGASTTGLHVLGYLPHHFITTYGLQTASILEFVMLSLALGDRLWMVKREQQSRMSEMNRELSVLNENLESIVVERTRKLEQKNLELRELAVRDSLTGLFNHSTTIELLEQLLQQSNRYRFSIAAIMLDLDHFKSINDGYGHATGDRVIEAVADVLKQSARSSDIVGRYGGEEFLIVLAHADESAAREYGERLLQRLRNVQVKGFDRPLTASAGISITGPANQGIITAEIIARADDALYESKRNGRDCLTVSEQSLAANA